MAQVSNQILKYKIELIVIGAPEVISGSSTYVSIHVNSPTQLAPSKNVGFMQVTGLFLGK